MVYSSSLSRWLRLKRYQFETNFSFYMLTSSERAIFYSIMFLMSALVVIATILYLPEHVNTIAKRASFYWAGEDFAREALVTNRMEKVASVTSSSVSSTVTEVASSVVASTASRVVDEL